MGTDPGGVGKGFGVFLVVLAGSDGEADSFFSFEDVEAIADGEEVAKEFEVLGCHGVVLLGGSV